jgi:sucrose-6-phosphate hydrolase SacC (GH32 family)
VDFNRKNLSEIVNISSKPILPLGDLGTFDEFGIYPVSVIKDGNRFLAYYGGWTRCESVPFNVAIGCAESIDGGHTFRRIGRGPVLSYSYDEPFILSGPKIRKFDNQFYLFYIAGRRWVDVNGKVEPVYKIRMATSLDGMNWQKLNRDLINDVLGEDEAQASPDVIYLNGRYHMFFCYRQPSDYRHNRDRSYRIGYASSNNLVDWVRDDRSAGLDVSDHGWDSEMVAYPHVFELDEKVYMYYLGNEVGRHGFGLAEMVK